MKFLNYFLRFDLTGFLLGKRLLYVKALPWVEEDQQKGSKVTVQIIEDKTVYPKADMNNFGEQFVVKVRSVAPETFKQFKPLGTEVYITNVERATVYGEYKNNISVIGVVSTQK